MKYELMVILDPKQSDKALEKTLSEIKGTFEENGFKMTSEDIWGHRDLAYKIKGHSKGYYVVALFEGEPEGMQQVKKDLAIQGGLLRNLIVKMPDDYTLIRYEAELKPSAGKRQLSKHAEELGKKVASKVKKEEPAKKEKAEEDEKKLDEQLKSIIEDKDIEL